MHERKSSRYRKRVKRKVYFSQIKYLQHIDICGKKKKKRSEEMERRKKQEMMKIKYLKRRGRHQGADRDGRREWEKEGENRGVENEVKLYKEHGSRLKGRRSQK